MPRTEQRPQLEIEQISLFPLESLTNAEKTLAMDVLLRGPSKEAEAWAKGLKVLRSLSRTSDPITSKVAGEKTKKFSGKHEAAIYAAICESGERGLTYKEIAQVAGLEPVAVARRLYAMSTRKLITRNLNEFKEPAEIRDGCAVWWKAK